MRARLEKRGSMDVLRNQIIERKVLDLILAQRRFKEVPYETKTATSAAIGPDGRRRPNNRTSQKPSRGSNRSAHPDEATK